MKLHNVLLAGVFLFTGTTALAQPSNDECAGAIPIACGGTVSGNTTDALADEAEECGTAIDAPGVWYVLEGTGVFVTATTCPDNTYDTKINVYVGACGTIACVAGNDDIEPGVLCSNVGFAAQPGQTYYILVQGYDGAVGTFDLSVTCAPLNEDVCEGAIPIACGETLAGSTAAATDDAVEECGTSITAPGVWYSFEGVDAQIAVTTCPDNTYDTKINVYSGSCDALVCVGGNDDIAEGVYCSNAVFNAVAGTTYHILVQGYDGETGEFELSVSCMTCGMPQSIAVTPLDVSATVTWSSANAGAQFTLEYGPAGFTPGTGTLISGTYGVDGPPVNIAGFTNSTEYEIYLQEDCGGGDISPMAGPIVFTTLGAPPAVNANCGGALPITCGGTVAGNTADGLFAPVPTCGAANVTTKGLWYSFTGDGQDVTLSTCDGSAYDTKLSVFTGPCETPACVAGSDDGPGCPGNTSSATFHTDNGTTYLILVHGYDQAQGEFSLAMTCSAPCTVVENDACATPTALSLATPGGCEASTGTTTCAFAPAFPNPPCDPWANIVDVWYGFNTSWATELSLLLAPTEAGYVNAAVYTACDGEYIDCWTEVVDPIDLSALPPNTDMLLRIWNGGGSLGGTFTVCVEGELNQGVQGTAVNGPMQIFPVPAHDRLTVRPLDGVRTLTVVDTQGRSVMTVTTHGASSVQVDTAPLSPGGYALMGDGRSLGRFIKE